MKKINLPHNKFTLVDNDDYEYLNQWNWCEAQGYVHRRLSREEVGKGNYRRVILMHRVINKTPEGMDVDHKNHNPLDNRKTNLRNVTTSQNLMNKRMMSSNTSGYKGVSFCGRYIKKWRAQLRMNKQQVFDKRFNTPEEAAIAYNLAATKYFGEYAVLNIL